MKTILFCSLMLCFLYPISSSGIGYDWDNFVAGNSSYSIPNMSVSIMGNSFDTRGPQDPNGGAGNGFKSPKYVSPSTISAYQGGSTNDYGMPGLVVGHDWTNLSSSTVIAITFISPVGGPVSFDIYDINTGSWGGNDPVWIDKITITGTDCAGNLVYPIITGCNNNVSGADNNVVTGNAGCTNNTNTVTFNSPSIQTITITYGSDGPLSAGYGTDPDPQYIIIGEIDAGTLSLLAVNNNNPSITCSSSTVTLSASSSISGANYSWAGPNSGNPAGTTPNASSTVVSATGIYTVTVSDAGSGCSASASVDVISMVSPVSINPTSTDATCGINNGTATVSPSGGDGSFTFHWGNNQSASTITSLAPGTYTVTVTSGSCTAAGSVTVGYVPPVSVTLASTDATCGNNNGEASVTAAGGNGIYTYNWSNSQTTSSAVNLDAGNYSVTVTSGGCASNATIAVGNTGSIVLNLVGANTSCGADNGSATVIASGGNGIYIYQWSNTNNTATASNLAAGTYTVTVSDNTGCSATTSVTINQSGAGTVHVTQPNGMMCAGDSIEICTDAPYPSYHWSNGATTECFFAKTAGNYYVTVTDLGNCTVVSNHVTVNVYPLTPVSITVNGDTLTSYNAITYQWYFNGNPINGATGHIYIAQQSGNYFVALTDSNGCRVFSNPVAVGTTGINDLNTTEAANVYPNPISSGNWQLTVSSNLIGSDMEIFDADGRLVFKSLIQSTESLIDLAAARGVYFLQIRNAGNLINRKLIHL